MREEGECSSLFALVIGVGVEVQFVGAGESRRLITLLIRRWVSWLCLLTAP